VRRGTHRLDPIRRRVCRAQDKRLLSSRIPLRLQLSRLQLVSLTRGRCHRGSLAMVNRSRGNLASRARYRRVKPSLANRLLVSRTTDSRSRVSPTPPHRQRVSPTPADRRHVSPTPDSGLWISRTRSMGRLLRLKVVRRGSTGRELSKVGSRRMGLGGWAGLERCIRLDSRVVRSREAPDNSTVRSRPGGRRTGLNSKAAGSLGSRRMGLGGWVGLGRCIRLEDRPVGSRWGLGRKGSRRRGMRAMGL
jgi:hypothetical protein